MVRPRSASTVAARIPGLPLAGVVVGLWAALPKFVSPELHVAESKEIADHVVPAIVVIGVSVTAVVLARRGSPPGLYMLIAGLVICLAGLWMVATHYGLVGQASRGESGVSWGVALHHSLPAAAVAVLGVVWVIRCWDAAA